MQKYPRAAQDEEFVPSSDEAAGSGCLTEKKETYLRITVNRKVPLALRPQIPLNFTTQ